MKGKTMHFLNVYAYSTLCVCGGRAVCVAVYVCGEVCLGYSCKYALDCFTQWIIDRTKECNVYYERIISLAWSLTINCFIMTSGGFAAGDVYFRFCCLVLILATMNHESKIHINLTYLFATLKTK